jgi:hypothetical protein
LAGQLASGAIVKMREHGDPVGKPVTIVSAGGTITYTPGKGSQRPKSVSATGK